MRIVDMHCDTIFEGWKHPERSFYDGETAVNLKRLQEHEGLLQFFALYIAREEMKTQPPYDILKSMYAYYEKQMEAYNHIIRPVYCFDDIEKNREKNIVSSLLSIEDSVFLDGKVDRVEEVYDMGVRAITLMWNYENTVGYPCHADEKEHARGLKPFGIEVIERMNHLGMLVDVSHMSKGGFYDVAQYSKAPFIASHSCARALCRHQRNLTDDQLRILGNAGGVAGVTFERSFLSEEAERATYMQVIAHLLHMKNKAGIEAVGFGSDFDGIDDNGELLNYSGFTTLTTLMEKYFTYNEIEKICTENVLRVIKDVMKG